MALKADTRAAKPGLLLLFLKSCSALTFRCPRQGAKGWRTLPVLGLPPWEGISLHPAKFIELWDIPGWKGFTGITESDSWPCTELGEAHRAPCI